MAAVSPGRIGHYELLRTLASGGMGEVYLARHIAAGDGFDSLVAVKVLLPHLTSHAGFVRMFLDEARAVARLRHEHVVQIRDVAQHDGQYYMVMEYIAGQNLRELLGDVNIDDRPLFSPRLGAQVFADLASALAVVHREGLVHRDLSPNNIMISDGGVAKLIDFGVVRALGTASLTNPGTLKGKFGYMAPEYIRSQAYDHRVDVFSLGVVMWETFTRRRLFPGGNAADQLHRVLEAPIPRLDDILPEFPADLADVVELTLVREPARRLATAGELADRLGDLARSLPIVGETSLRAWLERRVGERIAERRHLEQIAIALPPGDVLERALSVPPGPGGTASDYQVEMARAGAVTPAPTSVTSGTSMRLASGEVIPTTASGTSPLARRVTTPMVVSAAVILVLLLAVARGRRADETAAPEPARAAVPAAQPQTSPATLHKERGLKAMADRDYARAVVEFSAALRDGGGDEVLELLDAARRRQRTPKQSAPQAAPPSAATVQLDGEATTISRTVGRSTRGARAATASPTRIATEPPVEIEISSAPADAALPPDDSALAEPTLDAPPATRPTTAEPLVPITAPPRSPADSTAPQRPTPRVTADGDGRRGGAVVGRCSQCHAASKLEPVTGRSFSRAQWERFFSTGSHDRYLYLGARFSAVDLADARAYLRAHAYDAPENQAAGIRDP